MKTYVPDSETNGSEHSEKVERRGNSGSPPRIERPATCGTGVQRTGKSG
jgi:hypothetical protein